MINFKEYKKWENDPSSKEFGMICIGCDIKMKQIVLAQNHFNLENKIRNKEKFVEMIFEICKRLVGKRFKVKLCFEHANLLSLQKIALSDKQKVKLLRVSKYLNEKIWKKEKSNSVCEIKDLKTFLLTLLDFPIEFDYPSIEMFSLGSEILIIISDHSTVWFISKDRDLLTKIGKYFDSKEVTVLYSKPFFD